MSRKPYWGPDEEAEWESGGESERAWLMMMLARHVAGRQEFARCGLSEEDLAGEMVLMMLPASRNWDPVKGTAFKYMSTIAINAGKRACGKAARLRELDLRAMYDAAERLGLEEKDVEDVDDDEE